MAQRRQSIQHPRACLAGYNPIPQPSTGSNNSVQDPDQLLLIRLRLGKAIMLDHPLGAIPFSRSVCQHLIVLSRTKPVV